MEPNQGMNNAQRSMGAGGSSGMPNDSNAPVAENTDKDVVFRDKPKKNMAVILGMVILGILAIGGIGFGVWAMMDGNAQKDELNAQISSLKKQNSALSEQVSNLQTQLDSYSGIAYEILPPKWGEAEAVLVDGVFTIKNADGDIYMQFGEYEVDEIVLCDSGTDEAKAPLTCVVKTPEGEAKMIYDFDEQSLEYIASTKD